MNKMIKNLIEALDDYNYQYELEDDLIRKSVIEDRFIKFCYMEIGKMVYKGIKNNDIIISNVKMDDRS